MADRVIRVNSGRILSNEANPAPVPVEQIEW
jgi:putative ABC transport system ATP-binding protein